MNLATAAADLKTDQRFELFVRKCRNINFKIHRKWGGYRDREIYYCDLVVVLLRQFAVALNVSRVDAGLPAHKCKKFYERAGWRPHAVMCSGALRGILLHTRDAKRFSLTKVATIKKIRQLLNPETGSPDLKRINDLNYLSENVATSILNFTEKDRKSTRLNSSH